MGDRTSHGRRGEESSGLLSRRDAIRQIGGATLSLASTLALPGLPASGKGLSPHPGRRGEPGRYNILLIVVDQERYFHPWPFPVPARERLRKMGVSFLNHQIASNVCSPSRSVIYTGQHIQQTGVFDNVNAPWQPSMATSIPTVGHMLRKAGYYTAYKGKWHLSTELEKGGHGKPPTRILPDFLEDFGFSDYYGVGDAIGSARGGYLNDEIVAATSVRWMRRRGKPMARERRPWFLAVNLINPHDVMYLNSDGGEPVQTAGSPVMEVFPPPDTNLYQATWSSPLPASRSQPFDGKGRPNAHREYQEARSVLLGNWPNQDWRWQKLQDYYFNCIRDSDRHIHRMLSELEDQKLLEETIIVFTSDHGELGGAHQMHGKGACAYREQNHVPLIIVHPGLPGGRQCTALTSHLDITPTLLGLAGADRTAPTHLKGHDLSPLLGNPEAVGVNALRGGTLFNFNMFSFLDGTFLQSLKEIRDARRLKKAMKAIAMIRKIPPVLEKRGAIRSWFDGRYRFTRYFSPKQHHFPETFEQLVSMNDLELFDLENDPHELENLAMDGKRFGDLMMEKNAQLNRIVREEAGADDGRFLPLSKLVSWDLEVVDI